MAETQVNTAVETIDPPIAPATNAKELVRYPTLTPWPTLWIGISAAGVFYPVVGAIGIVGWFCLVAMANVIQGQNPEVPFSGLISLFFFASTVGCVLGWIAVSFVSVPALFVAWVGITTLRLKYAWSEVGAWAGGLTGFSCMFPIGYEECRRLLNHQQPMLGDVMACLTATALGPMLAIFCGQLCGASAGMLVDEDQNRCGRSISNRLGGSSFSLGQLLGLTMFVSLVMAALKLQDLMTSATALLVTCWLVWQTVSRYPALAIARRLARRRREALQAAKGQTPGQ